MELLGAKSKNLRKLSEAGFLVPKFFAVSSEVLAKGDLVSLAEKIHADLACDSYAVRSSALVEDTADSAHAGEFKTLLDVSPLHIAKAMQELCDDAAKKLGSLKNFALLVQEFIEPEAAGVFFTQHPGGDRGWVLEYTLGRGDKVVGGELKPIHKQGYWGAYTPRVGLADFSQMLEQFKAIEALFGAPQDIEWCQCGGKTTILQARPITSGTLPDVEKFLPKGPFFFEKTEISEVAPKPDAETLKLLETIYKKGGPVEAVYEKFGVHYQARDFLRLVAGELYIDKEAELKTLLPAYSFFKGKKVVQKPVLAHFVGFWLTMKNLYKLNRLPVGDYEMHFDLLKSRLAVPRAFSEDYELIFEINLISSCALAKLKPLLARNKGITLAELFASADALFPHLPHLKEPPKNLVGNSLDLQDASTFQAETKVKSHGSALAWWKGLSSLNRRILEKALQAALAYAKLREYARWLLVMHTNKIRPASKRKHAVPVLVLPKILSSFPIETTGILQCVSAGKAHGKLVTLEQVKKGEKGILLTKILSPNLVEFFPQVSGILSEEGGMLSHLAIMARENGIPVLVGVDLGTFKAGQQIELDATTLSIEPC